MSPVWRRVKADWDAWNSRSVKGEPVLQSITRR
jgi:hypothetical protein